jgi:hypothetical protein
LLLFNGIFWYNISKYFSDRLGDVAMAYVTLYLRWRPQDFESFGRAATGEAGSQ